MTKINLKKNNQPVPKNKSTKILKKPLLIRNSGNISALNRKKPMQNPVSSMVSRIPNNPAPVYLSPCAAKYAMAIANPWSQESLGACVPAGNSRESQKTTSFMRFDATVGTNGFGFVLVSPTIANNLASAWYSTSAFTNTVASFAVTGTNNTTTPGVNFSPMSNLPYASTDFPSDAATNANLGANLQGRIVSVGVSASYTGTELNMGGLVYCITDPNHTNQFGASAATVGQRLEADVSNVSRDKCWLMCSAVDSDEMEYPNVSSSSSEYIGKLYPFSRGAYISNLAAGMYFNGAAPMVIVFTGTPGNVMHIEVIQHTEYIGVATEGKTTPVVLDAVGANTVLSAANMVPQLKVSKPGYSYGQLFFEALQYTGRQLLPVAVGALKAMLI